MAMYNPMYSFFDQDVGYNSSYRPYYERESYRPYYGRESYRQQPYYDPVMHPRRPEPYFDNYRRDYRLQEDAYADHGRYGVLPMEEVFRREQVSEWMDDGYRNQRGGGYRIDRRDYHGGQNYGHGNFLRDVPDGYDHDRHGHNSHYSSRNEVELYVPICCDKCERKLRKHLEYLQGVETITMDQTSKKVVVFGNVNPVHVLNRARQDKPQSEFWHDSRYR